MRNETKQNEPKTKNDGNDRKKQRNKEAKDTQK